MTHPNISTALARVVVDELSAEGIEVVVISPGSRSGALAIAAAQHPDIETRVVIDERSAAFHALGVSKASSTPAAVLCTSGSAPANFFPAIVEAGAAGVPLVVISADRPAEMQGVGANQTTDQVEMFGAKVRRYGGIEAPGDGQDGNDMWRSEVARLASSARGPFPGPVHLNVRFREPTVPVSDDGRTPGAVPYPFGTPRLQHEPVTPDEGESVDLPPLDADRGVVIAGDGEYDRRALADRAGEIGWPILATALSRMRGTGVVSAYHHILSRGVPRDLEPSTVVAVGAVGPSPRLETMTAAADVRVRIDRWGRVIDPHRNATHVLSGDVVELLDRVEGSAAPAWREMWAEADRSSRTRLTEVLSGAGGWSGAAVASCLNRVGWDALVVASSLPIREIDAHLIREGPVYANRGVSGIDGFVSTALGVASRAPRTLALAGDLSLLHDSNGFIHDGSIDLTLVVVDNGGGGLFDSLPQARHAPDYERLFVTPPARSVEMLARFHGLRYQEAADDAELARLAEEGLGRRGVDVIRVLVDRGLDLEIRSQLES